jgi:flagellar M-ring protein FliF
LRRVSAAVVVDHKNENGGAASARRKVAYSPEEIQQINSLVKDAIGYVQARGDTVSVVNLPFSEEPIVEAAVVTPDLVSQLVRYGAIALAVIFAYFAILRPLLKPTPPPKIEPMTVSEPVPPAPSPSQVMREKIQEQEQAWLLEKEAQRAQELREAQESQERLARIRDQELASKAKIDDLVAYAARYAKEQPQDAALLLRAWLANSAPAKDRS